MKMYVIYVSNTKRAKAGYLADQTDLRPPSYNIRFHPEHFWDDGDPYGNASVNGEIVAFFSKGAANNVAQVLLKEAKIKAGSNFKNIIIEVRSVDATEAQVRYYYNKSYRFQHEE